MTARWITSSRLGNVSALRDTIDALQAAEEVLQAWDVANRIIARMAEAQAYIDNARSLASGRFLLGTAYEVLVSDLIGGLLNDSAYFITHTNLGRVVERYGIAPYLDHVDEFLQFPTEEPVKTLNRSVTDAFLDRMQSQGLRLGSSVLDTLRNEEPFDSFKVWLDDILFAFDDTGDFSRPIYEDGEELGGVLITVQGQDPQEIFDAFNALKSVFARKPPPSPIEFSATRKILHNYFQAFPRPVDLEDEEERNRRTILNALNLGETFGVNFFRPTLSPESWNTPPDFTRVSTRSLIPIFGDALLSLRDIAGAFNLPPAQLLSLEGLTNTLVFMVNQIQDTVTRTRAALQTLVNVLDATRASRLWIETQPGGVPGLMQRIKEADPTRKDLQRVTNIGQSTTYQLNDVIPYDVAVAERTASPGFQFQPVENLIVAGVGIFFHPGPLYEFLKNLLEPKEEDETENDTGVPVHTLTPVLDELAATLQVTVAGSPPAPYDDSLSADGTTDAGTLPSPETNTNPSDHNPPTSSTEDSPRDRSSSETVGSETVRISSHVSVDVNKRFLSLLPAGATRTTSRKTDIPEAGVFRSYTTGVGLDLFSAPLVVQAASEAESRVFQPLTESTFFTADRMPVGELIADVSARPSAAFPGIPWSPGPWVDTPLPVLDGNGLGHPITLHLRDGGTRFTSVELAAITAAVAPGYNGLTRPLYVDWSWYVDFPVTWKERSEGEEYLRTSWIRCEVIEVTQTPGPTTFKLFPVAPFWPRIVKSLSISGFFHVSEDAMFASKLLPPASGAPDAEEVLGAAPGITLETLVTFRRQQQGTALPISSPTVSLLQAEFDGVIVDSDARKHPGTQTASITEVLDTRVPKPAFSVATVQGAVVGLRNLHGSSFAEVQSAAGPGDVVSLFPRRAEREFLDRQLNAVVSIPNESQRTADLEFQRNDRTAHGLEFPGGHSVLTTHVPRLVRLGMGTLGEEAPYELPIASVSWRAVLVQEADGELTLWSIGSALLGSSVAVNVVEPSAALLAAATGLNAYLVVETDADVASILGRLVPYVRHFSPPESTVLWDENDRVVTASQLPVFARAGLLSPGAAAPFCSVEPFSESTYNFEAGLLIDTSRKAATAQGRSVTLTVTPQVPWSSLRNGVYTLWETQSHLLVLRASSTLLWLELLEVDLLTSALVRRSSMPIQDVFEGWTHRFVSQVDPYTQKMKLSVSRFVDEAGSSDLVLSDQLVVIDPSDVHPYVRAVDGFLAPGATIRLGRRGSSSRVLQGSREHPWSDEVEVLDQGVPTTYRFFRGTPPLVLRELSTQVVSLP